MKDLASSSFRLKEIIYSFFFFTYLELFILKMFVFINTFLFQMIVLFVSLLCYLVSISKRGPLITVNRMTLLFLLTIIPLGIIIQMLNFREFTGLTLSAISAILLGFVFYKNRIYLPFLYLHLIVISVLIGRGLILGMDLNQMFLGTSRNSISILFIVTVLIINVQEFKQAKPISVMPAIISFMFCALSAGRSGIVCSLIYLGYLFFYKLYRMEKEKRRKVLFISFSIIFISAFYYKEQIFEFVSNMEVYVRLTGQANSGNERTLMNSAYLENMNFFTFLIGYDFVDNYEFIKNGLNPHNSFLSLHHFYGLAGVLFFGIFIITLFHLWKINKIYSVALFILLLRASTDQMMFPGEYDFLVISMVLENNVKILNN